MEKIERDINYRHAAILVLESAQRKGVVLAPLLQAAKVDACLFDKPQLLLDGGQFVQLLQQVTLALGDEFYGLSSRPVKVGSLSMMVDISLHAQSLSAALQDAMRFMSFISDDLVLALNVEQGSASITVRHNAQATDPANFLSDYFLFLLHRLCSWLIGYFIPLQGVCFDPQSGASEDRFVNLLTPQWQTTAGQNSLHFSHKYLAMPVVKNAVEWQQHLNNVRDGLFSWPNRNSGLAGDVRRLLVAQLRDQYSLLSLSQVASHLALSPQTLRRRLQEQDASFQALADSLRRDMAIEGLSLQGQSVDEISLRLGFSEARSFSRAFKKWTGLSPSQYLRRRDS